MTICAIDTNRECCAVVSEYGAGFTVHECRSPVAVECVDRAGWTVRLCANHGSRMRLNGYARTRRRWLTTVLS